MVPTSDYALLILRHIHVVMTVLEGLSHISQSVQNVFGFTLQFGQLRIIEGPSHALFVLCDYFVRIADGLGEVVELC